MKDYSEFLDKNCFVELDSWDKYPKIGKCYEINNEQMFGYYWYYETKNFIIDIHDFFTKSQDITKSMSNIDDYIYIYTSYIFTGSGEYFNPYQTISSNMIYYSDMTNAPFKCTLHENFPYYSLGINYKKEFIDNYLDDEKIDINQMFVETTELITKPIYQISREIIDTKLSGDELSRFLEQKALDWVNLVYQAYKKKLKIEPLSKIDDQAISDVASYINDHYTTNIQESFLEKIAMMGSTKLKKVFKQKYGMSITEYTQRKRMNIAETLLLNTNLEIKDIASSVGYTNPSKFTACYKRYKGMYPSNVRKLSNSN